MNTKAPPPSLVRAHSAIEPAVLALLHLFAPTSCRLEVQVHDFLSGVHRPRPATPLTSVLDCSSPYAFLDSISMCLAHALDTAHKAQLDRQAMARTTTRLKDMWISGVAPETLARQLQRKAEVAALRQEIEATQQRHHSFQIEALRVSEQAQRATQRGEQLAAELEEIAAQAATENARKEAAAASLNRLQGEAAESKAQLDLATDLYRRAEAVLELQRAALLQAQRDQQEASFRLRSSDNKIIEIENSIKAISESEYRVAAALAVRQQELAGYDEAPLQQQLQQALAHTQGYADSFGVRLHIEPRGDHGKAFGQDEIPIGGCFKN